MGFRISGRELQIPKPRISDPTSKNFLDSGIQKKKFQDPGNQIFTLHGARFDL